jgi:hypothetical protein
MKKTTILVKITEVIGVNDGMKTSDTVILNQEQDQEVVDLAGKTEMKGI